MRKINPLISNVIFQSKKDKPKEQTFGNNYVQNYAPAPIYTQVPYGIHQRNYIKLGVDKLPNGDELHLYKLSNGQSVEILKAQKGSTSILTKVNVGAMDEEGFSKGISHFIEHSLFHGSEKYKNDLKSEIDRIATYDNASTSIDSTTYYMDLASDSIEDIAKAIDIQSDMLLRPTFSQIEKEKPIVCAEYERSINDELRIKLQQRLANLYPNLDSKYFLISGDNESINSITQQEMYQYHQKYYQPHNMNTIIATKNNPDEIIKTIADSFVTKSPKNQNQIKRNNPTMLSQPKRIDLVSKEDIFGSFEVAFPCENLDKKEELKLNALCELIFKRYVKLPNFSLDYNRTGSIVFSEFDLEENKPNETLAFISQVIKEISLRPPTSEEIEEIKKTLKEDTKRKYNNSNSNKIEEILNKSFYNGNHLTYQAQEQLIDSLTDYDIVQALKYLDFNRMSLTIMHPKGTTQEKILEENKKYIPLAQPIVIPANFNYNNYYFSNLYDQISGEKFYSTTLQNGTKLVILNSEEDEKCEINWRLYCGDNYSSNPALKYILKYLNSAYKSSAIGNFFNQDSIEIAENFELKDFQKEIVAIKSFNSLKINEKDFNEAKKEALKDVESLIASPFSLFEEMVCGKKYNTDIETLKKQIEQLSLNDVINEFNNMIVNSSSTIVIKAPINKNTGLLNTFANALDSTGFSFKPFDSYQNPPQRDIANCDCLIKTDEINQNNISQIHQFKVNGNFKDDVAFRLLANILKNKNFEQIREKDGLAYATSVDYVDTYGIGAFYLNTESSCTNKGDIEKILKGYKSGIQEVKQGNITKDELTFAKNKLKGELMDQISNTTPEFNYYLHELALLPNGLESLSQIADIIDSITIEDLQKYSNYAFNNKAKYAISAHQDVIDKNMELFNKLGKIEKR